MIPYVIKKWYAEHTPDEDGRYVRIQGRQGGAISWVLSLLRIDPTVSIHVYEDKFVFESGSLAGMIRRIIPLGRGMISSMMYGYSKPWSSALVILAAFVFFGIMVMQLMHDGSIGVLLILSGIVSSILYYLLNKKMTLGVIEVGGIPSVIEFKRSVIENQNIDESEAERVINIIQMLVDRHEGYGT